MAATVRKKKIVYESNPLNAFVGRTVAAFETDRNIVRIRFTDGSAIRFAAAAHVEHGDGDGVATLTVYEEREEARTVTETKSIVLHTD